MNICFQPEHSQQALLWLQVLHDFGFGKQQIRFRSYDPEQRSSYRQEWRKKLGLHKKISITSVRSTKRISPSTLSITPVYDNGRDQMESSPAWRFFMVMLSLTK